MPCHAIDDDGGGRGQRERETRSRERRRRGHRPSQRRRGDSVWMTVSEAGDAQRPLPFVCGLPSMRRQAKGAGPHARRSNPPRAPPRHGRYLTTGSCAPEDDHRRHTFSPPGSPRCSTAAPRPSASPPSDCRQTRTAVAMPPPLRRARGAPSRARWYDGRSRRATRRRET